jgi:hypothetical protein
MFEELPKREVVGWVVCLVLAIGLTVLGSVYLATSLMMADVSDALPYSAKRTQDFKK